ncbi:MAG: PDZ domain-containing protein [Syntrophaceae bacterium]|nr:PDZ domain-containing protein [Syntrophaceae bacterium]
MLDKIQPVFDKWITKGRDFFSGSSLDSAKLLVAAVFVAITIISYQGVSLFYKMVSFMIISKSSSAVNSVSYDSGAQAARREPLPSYAVITQRNLFKTTLKEVAGEGGGLLASGEEIAEFDLKGTIAGTDSFGYIIIEEKTSKKQRLYKLGSMIGSARVVSISRNTATINKGGRNVTLKIKQTPEGSVLGPGSFPGRPMRGNINAGRMAVSRSEVTEKLQDLQSIMTDAQIRPYFESGAQQGFIISNIKPNSLYQKLGLRNGDVVIDVNNKAMRSADDIMELINLMQSGQNIAVNLKRGGKPQNINYSFK